MTAGMGEHGARAMCGVWLVLLAGCVDTAGHGAAPSANDAAVSDRNTALDAGGSLPACVERRLEFGACVVQGDSTATEHVSMNGVVSSISHAGFATCASHAIGEVNGVEEGEHYDLNISDGHTDVRVSVRLPEREPIINAGEFVNVEYALPVVPRGPSDGRLVLRNADGELLLAMIQVNEGLSELALPEVAISDGEHTCTARDDNCGTATRGDILVRRGSEEITIEHGGRAELGDYVVLHGENRRFNAIAGACTHSWSHHVGLVAVVRRSEAELAGDGGL